MRFAHRNGHRSHFLLNPVGNEDVEFPWLFPVARRCEDELFAILGQHREAIEPGAIRYAFQAGPIDVDGVKGKTLTLGIVQVG